MKHYFEKLCILLISLTICGCGESSNIHDAKPLSYNKFKKLCFLKTCYLDSGRNALKIYKSDQGNVIIESNRFYIMGSSFKIKVAGQNFSTRGKKFTGKQAEEIFQLFKTSDKAYIENREIRGDRGFKIFRTIIDLENSELEF